MTLSVRFRVVLAVLVAAIAASACAAAEVPLRDGDIIFHTSRSAQSVAIQRATRSRYSHMGLILHRDGRPFVFEAVSTVKFTPLAEWIARGEGGRYVVKRWRDAAARLDAAGGEKLRAQAAALAGRRYDLTFEWDDDRIYCSELVWKAYERAFGVQLLPEDVYYITGLPTELQASDVTTIACVALVMAFLATLYPAWRAARTAPAEALRYE